MMKNATMKKEDNDSQYRKNPKVLSRPMLAAPRAPATQQALTALQEKIFNNEWPAGFRLPSQRELADQVGVSRASLREAISSWEAMGLVRVEPGRGVFVTSQEERVASSQQLFEATRDHSIVELYEARLLMEGWAAALAARTISEDQLLELQTIVKHMQSALKSHDLTTLDRLDFEFHSLIVSACTNRLLRRLLAPVFSEQDMTAVKIVDAAFISGRVKEHRDIVGALSKRDPHLAQSAMRTHILNTAKRAQVDLPLGIADLP
jgi:GntR family transcriptional repressor for pyruvate dehydrogenase complex